MRAQSSDLPACRAASSGPFTFARMTRSSRECTGAKAVSGAIARRVGSQRRVRAGIAAYVSIFRMPVETYAVRVTSGDSTLAYSADTGPCDALGRLADQADLFVCEAAWAEWPEGVPPIHLTPQLAGEWASKARARRLLLTHLRPGSDPAAAAARAAETYGGPVGVATELEVHQI